jgi:HlyD family secretion protein
MSPLRRYLLIGGVVFSVLGGAGIIVRTMLRQSRGPIAEDVRAADRRAAYARAVDAPNGAIEGNGIVEPVSPEMRLTTDIAGRISALFVREGDDVEKGAVLAEVDNAVQRAQVARAEADISAATAELQRVMHGMRAQDVNAVASEAIAAKARAALAASELARTEELVSKGTIASAELEMSKRRAEAESAAARAATERAQGASAGSRQEDVLVAQARLKAATASLEEARGALARTQIIAPRAGKVLRLKLHVGEYHNPAAEPLLILADVGKIRVRMDVDERDIARVKLDSHGWVTAPAFGGQKFPAKVVEISRRMGRRSVRVDDPKDRIDVKVLETLLELEGTPPLVTGMRVSAFVKTE